MIFYKQDQATRIYPDSAMFPFFHKSSEVTTIASSGDGGSQLLMLLRCVTSEVGLHCDFHHIKITQVLLTRKSHFNTTLVLGYKVSSMFRSASLLLPNNNHVLNEPFSITCKCSPNYTLLIMGILRQIFSCSGVFTMIGQ